jgi:hypothetical protein
MGVSVTFDYSSWQALFPQFSNVTEPQIAGPVLTLAQTYCRNDGGGPVNDTNVQTQLLNLMVAHVAQLLYGSTTQPQSPLVGRPTSAGTGSVHVTSDFPTSPSNAWYLQTSYGAMFWQLSLPYRTGIYAPKTTALRAGHRSFPYGY